jgi:hypothetical protein
MRQRLMKQAMSPRTSAKLARRQDGAVSSSCIQRGAGRGVSYGLPHDAPIHHSRDW